MCAAAWICFISNGNFGEVCSEHSSSTECSAHLSEADTGGCWLTAAGMLPQRAVGCPFSMCCSWSIAMIAEQPGTASLHLDWHGNISASWRAAIPPATHCHVSD